MSNRTQRKIIQGLINYGVFIEAITNSSNGTVVKVFMNGGLRTVPMAVAKYYLRNLQSKEPDVFQEFY